MTDRPLTPKQRAFVAAYVGAARGNGAEAARLAGYAGTPAVLAAMAQQNLGLPHIASALETFRLATEPASIMSATEAAERLSRIARGDEDIKEKRVVNGGQAGFVDVETPPSITHQIDAIKVLSKMRGYEAPTKTEVTGALAVEVSLSPEQESALASWLLIRDDPRVRSILEEYGA